MFLTLKELDAQIKRAKKQLVTDASRWLAAQNQPIGFNGEEWIMALQAKNRKLMNELIQEYGLPLEYNWTLINSPKDANHNDDNSGALDCSPHVVDANEAFTLHRSTYTPYVSYPFLSAVAYLTTCMEQLFLLEEQLLTSDIQINFKELNLVDEMLNSIINELRFAASGRETLDYYRQRLMQTEHLFNHALVNNNDTVTILDKQAHYKLVQFNYLLTFLAQTVQDNFSFIPDQRFSLIKLLKGYNPWQAALNHLADAVFAKNALTYPTYDQMLISTKSINSIITHFKALIMEPLSEINEQLEQKSEQIRDKIALIHNKLESMSQRLDVFHQLMGRPMNAVALLPTQLLPLHGFFQTLQSVYGTVEFQRRLKNEQNGDAEAPEQQWNHSMN